jgi:hypothetical protein
VIQKILSHLNTKNDEVVELLPPQGRAPPQISLFEDLRGQVKLIGSVTLIYQKPNDRKWQRLCKNANGQIILVLLREM